MMNRNLLEMLACPDCGSDEIQLTPEDCLSCRSCQARYPVINGVPQMLPTHLADKLAVKDDYTQKLMTAMREGGDIEDGGNPETDRFMWEHHLYDWGKHIIFSSSAAADIFVSYAEKGAQQLCRSLNRIAGDLSGKRLLYVGSGNDSMVALPLEADGAFVVNLDIVNDSMQDLTAMGAKACICGDIRQLPFCDESFDVVFSKGSLHHSQPIDEPLQSMVRVTKSGGFVVLVEPSKYVKIPRSRLPEGLAVPTPYEQHISSREVAGILRRTGVSDVRIDAFTHVPPGTPGLAARLWESAGNAIPLLFRHLAFEFIVSGRRK